MNFHKNLYNRKPFFRFLFGLFAAVICVGSLSACASPNRKVFVYGFGDMTVPKEATINEINGMVREMYGAELFWTPR